MQPKQIGIIALGGFGAIAFGFILHGLTVEAPTGVAAVSALPVEEKIEVHSDARVKVLSTLHALSVGTELKQADFAWIDWPADLARPEYVTQNEAADAFESYKGAVLRADSRPGEPLLKTALVRTGDGSSMAALLGRGMRPFAVNISPTTASGGFIMPGDRVDIMLSQKIKLPNANDERSSKKAHAFNPAPGLTLLQYLSQKHPEMFRGQAPNMPPEAEDPLSNPDKTAAILNGDIRPDPFQDISRAMNKQIWSFHISDGADSLSYVETIMKNVKILAIDRSINRGGGGQQEDGQEKANINRGGSMATLEVTPEQAEFLTLAQQFGSVSLSLRSLTDNRVENAGGAPQIPQISGFFGRFMPGQIPEGEGGVPTAPRSFTIMRGTTVSKAAFANAGSLNAENLSGADDTVTSLRSPEGAKNMFMRLLTPLKPVPEPVASPAAAGASAERSPAADLLQTLRKPLNGAATNAPNPRSPL